MGFSAEKLGGMKYMSKLTSPVNIVIDLAKE